MPPGWLADVECAKMPALAPELLIEESPVLQAWLDSCTMWSAGRVWHVALALESRVRSYETAEGSLAVARMLKTAFGGETRLKTPEMRPGSEIRTEVG